MEHSLVKVQHLSHRYSREWAIKDINFEINTKGILGLLGSNGAGKSTTMNIICGVLKQSKGDVFIDGISMVENPFGTKKLIGFLPQSAPLHLDLTVYEYLKYCAEIRKIEVKKVTGAVDEAMNRCGVSHFRNRLIRNLSGGYRQRVGIAQAIIHKPKLVVLDEPTNGLDPNQIIEVRKLIKEIGNERSVIFSTHILSEVHLTCDHIRMIEGGKMVFSGSMHDFDNYIEPDSLVVTFDQPPLISELTELNHITSAEHLYDSTFRLKFLASAFISRYVVEVSVARGWGLREITFEKSSLDDIFAQLSKHNKT